MSEIVNTLRDILHRINSIDCTKISLPPGDSRVSDSGSLILERNVSEDNVKCDYICCAPKFCRGFRNIRMFLFWVCWCAFVQSTTINGFIGSVISTLELRYELKSIESGAIASLYDIGVVIVLIPLTYLGGDSRKPRVISIGMMIMAMGSFLFVVPHATSGFYEYRTPTPPVCHRYSNFSFTCVETWLNNYKYFFWSAALLIGIGSSPLYTLGTAYMDDNLPSNKSALYIGIYYSISLIGPAIGYLLCGTFLEIYVDIGYPHPGLDSSNRQYWVGAWWLGFLITGFMALIGFLPMYGFPKELPDTQELRTSRKSEALSCMESVDGLDILSFKLFAKQCKILLQNVTFMSICIAGTLDGLVLSGFNAFGPKYLETAFDLRAATATRLFGFVLVPAGGGGMFFGGFVISYFKMNMNAILRMQFFTSLLMIPLMFIFLISCGENSRTFGIAGVTVPYNKSETLESLNLTNPCNADCKCKLDSLLFEASCGINRITYYSPCYAGCTSNTGSGYNNCTCISVNDSFSINDTLKIGACIGDCQSLALFLALFGLVMFMVFSISTQCVTSTLRSVSKREKTFALGIQWFMMRVCGTIPGPLIFGYVIDFACALWNQRCEVRSSCAFYRGATLRDIMLYFSVSMKIFTTFFLYIAWHVFRFSDKKQGECNEITLDPMTSIFRNDDVTETSANLETIKPKPAKEISGGSHDD